MKAYGPLLECAGLAVARDGGATGARADEPAGVGGVGGDRLGRISRRAIYRLKALNAGRDARAALLMHLEHGFEAWGCGNVLGMRAALNSARRCEHVIRLAKVLNPSA